MEQWEKDYLEIIAQDKANKRKAEETKIKSYSKTRKKKVLIKVVQAIKDVLLVLIGVSMSVQNGLYAFFFLCGIWVILKFVQNELKEDLK